MSPSAHRRTQLRVAAFLVRNPLLTTGEARHLAKVAEHASRVAQRQIRERRNLQHPEETRTRLGRGAT